VLAGFLLLLLSLAPARAQDTGAVLLGEAQKHINATDYDAAVEVLTDLVTNYQSSLAMAEGLAKLGYVQMLRGDFEKARERLRQALEWPNANDAIKQMASNLIPQAISAQASALEDDQEERKKQLYQEAITAFDKFLEGYPEANAAAIEGAMYGKALAQYFSEAYLDAAETLEQTLGRFPDSVTVGDNKYLLSVALSSRAAELLRQDREANLREALSMQDRALTLLREVRELEGEQRNEALINDAHFQSGELLFQRSTVVEDAEEKDRLRKLALEEYRLVRPKELMVRAQQELVQRKIAQIRRALRQGNRQAQEQFEAQRDRQAMKLMQLRNKPAQTIDAKLGMARILYDQERFDATRVLVDFLANFELSDNQKKNLLYYRTLSYARQNVVEPAVAEFENYQADFAGDPAGENLPIVIGNLFLESDPQKALEYYQTYLDQFPNGELRSVAYVSRAQALQQLGRMDEAQQAFEQAAASSNQEAVAFGAMLGKANVLLTQQKFDEAITLYDQVLEQYGGMEGAEEALYRKGSAQLQKQDYVAAMETLEAFQAENPDSRLTPFMLMDLGQARGRVATQQDPVNTELLRQAIEDLRRLHTEFPDTSAAPYAYFFIAEFQSYLGNAEAVQKAYQDYITSYPDHSEIYFAYNQLAQMYINGNMPREAAVLWTEFVDDNPDHQFADVVLMSMAQLWERAATNMGFYNGLETGQQAEWAENMRNAVDSAERLARNHPESQYLRDALTTIRGIKLQQVKLRLAEREDVANYLKNLADSLAATEEASKTARVVYAGFIYPMDEEQALEILEQAYSPELNLPASDLDLYALELVERGELDRARQIYEKIAADHPVPQDRAPTQAPREVQEAQAIHLFGLGTIATARGNPDEAGTYFAELKSNYPWHPKIGQANYGIALSQFRDGNLDEALQGAVAVIRDQSRAVTSELRAKAHLLGGKVLMERNQPGNPRQNKPADMETARQYIQKVPVAYPSLDFLVAEAYWLLAKIYEATGKPELKQEALDELNRYPESPFHGRDLSEPPAKQ
jgi:tetratricopeptide (TPR) repeat protein